MVVLTTIQMFVDISYSSSIVFGCYFVYISFVLIVLFIIWRSHPYGEAAFSWRQLSVSLHHIPLSPFSQAIMAQWFPLAAHSPHTTPTLSLRAALLGLLAEIALVHGVHWIRLKHSMLTFRYEEGASSQPQSKLPLRVCMQPLPGPSHSQAGTCPASPSESMPGRG